MTAKGRIIVIDDEESITFSLERLLSRVDYDVETASNLTEARYLVATRTYDVAIIDRMLPDGEDGVDFLEELQVLLPRCQSIIISAYPSYVSSAKSMRYNTMACLTKPLEMHQLAAIVEKAVALSK